jgi:D-serine dehydratase
MRPALDSELNPAMAGIDDAMLDGLVKGIPGGTAGLRLGDIGRQGWNLLAEDLALPVAVIHEPVMAANSRWMAGFLKATGALLAPHGKTTMSPQLFRRQLADGAWAITVATVQQLLVARRFGVVRVLLANQIVGRQAARTIVAELAADPGFEFYGLADSPQTVAGIANEARRAGLARPVNLLLEGGMAGGRTGCRDVEGALAVARAIAAAHPWVSLAGVEGFEGLVRGDSEPERLAGVHRFLDHLCAIAAACQREGLFAPGPVILTAGGSSYYDLVVARLGAAGIADARIVTRSGCYLTHDSGLYRQAFAHLRQRSAAARAVPGGLAPALELWAYVQSRPEPGRAILTLGKRDAGHDAGFPVPERWHRPGAGGTPLALGGDHRVVELNDQHAHMVVPPHSPLGVGDMVGLGVSHPCTTFDKWQVIFLVDAAYRVTGAIRTFF